MEHAFAKGTRDKLITIAPGGKLVGDIITMVACMMTHDNRARPGGRIKWWMPTQFAVKCLAKYISNYI